MRLEGAAAAGAASEWQLLLRDHCGLCDQALLLLAQARFPEFETIWIDESPVLEQRYGQRIPVLRHGTAGEELDWPFERATITAWLQRIGSAGQARQEPARSLGSTCGSTAGAR